jgi:hypothetical protein
MDQRVALLAIEDVSPDKPKRIPDVEDVANPVASIAEDALKREEEKLENGKQDETGGKSIETEDDDDDAAAEDTEMEEVSSTIANGHADSTVDANERKRRASEEVEGDTTETVESATAEPVDPLQQQPEASAVVPVVRVVKRMRSASIASSELPRMAQHRSSTPPRRYLEPRDEIDEEVRRLDEATPLVLRSPKHPLSRSASTSASTTTTGRARAATSVEDLHADFDQKVRLTMRLQRDVTRRSTATTRKRQLPRLPTPSRAKTHWDFLLEEMRWMATDFSHERNWKRVVQHHLAKEVVVAQNAERVRREKENRQLARDIAQQVSAFWRTIERIAARSHVRFEGGVGAVTSSGGGGTETPAETESRAGVEDGKVAPGESGSEIGSDLTGGLDEIALQFRTIEVTSTLESEAVESTKRRVQQVVVASRKARTVLQLSPEEASVQSGGSHEKVVQSLLDSRATSSPTTIFTTFQIVALRWMLEMCVTNSLNVLLNDQLGMGKASTVSAFLRAMQYLEEDEGGVRDVSRPHLLVVPPDELHKWCYHLSEWNRECGIVQVYTGSTTQRATLRAEWSKKLNVQPFFSADEVADLEKEDATPIFACVCGAAEFEADADAFLAFDNWRTVVVENDHGGLFEDTKFVETLCKIRQSGRRVLSSSQALESWSSHKIRNAYGGFLLDDGAEWHGDLWAKKVVLNKASAAQIVRWFGKTGSSSLLKTQQDHLTAVIVALHCLSLRRVRSECESELGKLEETSVACTLSSSQRTQYRNAVAGFVSASSSSSPREDRLELWLQLFLKLRSVCNCVDLLNDPEKLALADLPFLFSSSAKLQQLHELLSRIIVKEHRRVVVYCQLDAMFPVVEMLLALLDINFVRVTGSVDMQRRALCHFALRPAVHVAMVSTRLSGVEGKQSIPVYGADAIVMLDSDWNATCDAKLRASWAKCTVGKAFDMPVYRFHCDETIEAALLRGGSCFSEKVFSEMSPQEVVAEAAGGELKKEKPVWWSANGSYSASPPTKLHEAMAATEASEKYCGVDADAATLLRVVNVELDAEEHLLLANSDELTRVEWYAVNYLYSTSTDKKQRADSGGDHSGGDDEWVSAATATSSVSSANPRMTFEQLAISESRRMWQELDAETDLFYRADDIQNTVPATMDDATLQQLLRPLRARGLDPHYDVMRPPQVPSSSMPIDSEPIVMDDTTNQMMFRVAYREPAPPAPPPSLILKLKADTSMLHGAASTDASGKPLKKKRKDLAGRVGASGASAASNAASSSTAGGPGVKRKHDPHLSNGAAGTKPPKEPRLDFDGIPLPSDMAEFADDDFWGDTNLDALDSATWDDPAVLSGILGPTLESSQTTGTSSSSGTATGTGTTKKKVKSGGARSGQESGGTGRSRKGSISDAGKDGWNVQDDIVLKKLFELYGSNWTLIAHVFNTATSVSRFVFRKRTPRQCYDRYGKIISSGSLSGTATPPGGSTPTKDGGTSKASGAALLKQHKLNAAAAAVWTPQVLAERIGIPSNETLLVFAARDSLPGVPPPSITNVPTLAELTLKKKKKTQKQQSDAAASTTASTSSPVLTASAPGGLDDLKSIRTSFDAIIQCMKRKTPPPPIPIPQPSTVTTSDPLSATTSAAGVPNASPTTRPHSIVTPVPLVVPPPHKSHVDLVEMLPRVPLAPDDVIKRSKEAAAVAVQAAAAVASAGRAGAAGESLVNAGGAFNSSAVAARKAQAQGSANAASMASAAAVRPGSASIVNAASVSKLGGGGPAAWGDPVSAMRSSPAAPSGGMHVGMATGTMGPTATTAAAVSLNGARGAASVVAAAGTAPGVATGAMPVTTSALLHVLDRMPEIKHKIQAILNRTDCSEAQKVAMIARLLSNTNAINATAVAAAATGNLSAAVSATIAAANVNVSVGGPMPMVGSQSLDTPIPMPASLANDPLMATPTSMPAAIPMPASIAASVNTGATTATSAAAAAASSAALASALADTDMADLA